MPTANELYDLAVDLRDQRRQAGRSPTLGGGGEPRPGLRHRPWHVAKLYADLAEGEKAIAHASRSWSSNPTTPSATPPTLRHLPAMREDSRGRARQGHGLGRADGLRVS